MVGQVVGIVAWVYACVGWVKALGCKPCIVARLILRVLTLVGICISFVSQSGMFKPLVGTLPHLLTVYWNSGQGTGSHIQGGTGVVEGNLAILGPWEELCTILWVVTANEMVDLLSSALDQEPWLEKISWVVADCVPPFVQEASLLTGTEPLSSITGYVLCEDRLNKRSVVANTEGWLGTYEMEWFGEMVDDC